VCVSRQPVVAGRQSAQLGSSSPPGGRPAHWNLDFYDDRTGMQIHLRFGVGAAHAHRAGDVIGLGSSVFFLA
jgi:hypothetical protein